jgi:hypothetical protein
MVESIGRDIRHSLRLMRRWPAFAVVAIGTLALGISTSGRSPNVVAGLNQTAAGDVAQHGSCGSIKVVNFHQRNPRRVAYPPDNGCVPSGSKESNND